MRTVLPPRELRAGACGPSIFLDLGTRDLESCLGLCRRVLVTSLRSSLIVSHLLAPCQGPSPILGLRCVMLWSKDWHSFSKCLLSTFSHLIGLESEPFLLRFQVSLRYQCYPEPRTQWRNEKGSIFKRMFIGRGCKSLHSHEEQSFLEPLWNGNGNTALYVNRFGFLHLGHMHMINFGLLLRLPGRVKNGSRRKHILIFIYECPI